MIEQPDADSRRDDLHALADAETFLVRLLNTSVPPRDPGSYELTDVAEEFHAKHGTYDLAGADADELEELLARHMK